MDSIYSVGRGARAAKKKQQEEKKDDDAKKITSGSIRMQIDMNELDLPENVKLVLSNEQNLMNFKVTIKPDQGYWKGAKYTFRIAVPENYPHKPPKVVCEDLIYHPNIDLKGAVCLNILKDDWVPILNTQNVIHGLIFLFIEPNPADPLNQEASAVLRKDPAQFKRNVDSSLNGGVVDGVQFPRNK
jgi:ubiquitin-conjugating enzyme E2 M